MEYITLFSGVRTLMKADKICQEEQIEAKIIPIPHQYSSECGMALVVKEEDLENFKIRMTQNAISFELHPWETKIK